MKDKEFFYEKVYKVCPECKGSRAVPIRNSLKLCERCNKEGYVHTYRLMREDK